MEQVVGAVQADHHLHGLFLEFRSVILSFRHFPRPPFREDLIDLPVRELGGTSSMPTASTARPTPPTSASPTPSAVPTPVMTQARMIRHPDGPRRTHSHCPCPVPASC